MKSPKLLAAAIMLATIGCCGTRETRDLSKVPPYSQRVNVTYQLTQDATLRHGGTLYDWIYMPGACDARSYYIAVDPTTEYQDAASSTGAHDPSCTARLPKGYEVRVEAIYRSQYHPGFEFDVDDAPHEFAIVSLQDPRSPGVRIQAAICLDDLDKCAN
jgi:hypothetical protein